MSSHVYHEIYLHLNWHTKDGYPTLKDATENLAYKMLRDKCGAMKGVYLHELGGTDDHVHLALSIEPFVTISDMIGEIKGASSFELNKCLARRMLEWQRGYGVVSFGRSHLDWVQQYIRSQRQHHVQGTTETRLETHDTDEGPDTKPG